MSVIAAATDESDRLKVLVDGTAIEVADGATALDALRLAGLDVPTACHDPRVASSGSCRLCLVGIRGMGKPVASCAYRVRNGDVIEVDTPELEEGRRGLVGILAANYPEEVVGQFPEKDFHRWLRQYGLRGGRTTRSKPADETNPYFRFEPDACIACYRCVAVCDDLQGSFVWKVVDRGFETHLAPDSFTTLAESSCKSCGACVDACPTGALVDKTRIECGPPESWTRTTCPYCGVGCELSVGTKSGRIVQVLPVLDSPVSKGHLCVKGRYAHQYVHAEDRVTRPLVRKNGVLEEASWEEAIGRVALAFQRIVSEHGPDAVGVLGSARAPNEDNYLVQKFARVVLGTNNVDCCARVCHGPTAAAMKAMLGTGAATNSYDDLERAKTILVAGSNPNENHPIVGERIKQAVLDGAKLIVIDPRRIELARFADVHVALRPGTNVPLFNAMANVILEEGLEDPGFVANRVEGVAEFAEFVHEWTPERAAPICGVEADTIRTAARLYATEKPAMAFHGLGMTEHLQGTEGVMCLVNLSLLTGNIGKPGTGINPLRGQNNVQGSAHMGCEPSNLTGFVSIPEGRERFGKVWGIEPPESNGMHLMQMLDAASEGRLKAIWAIGYDVLATNSHIARTGEAFAAMDTVVVQDIFLNETAREFADVFLPACSSFERDGTFMNAERRVQRVRKAIDPIGDSRPDWEIVQLVANAMGHAEGFDFASPREIWDEVRQVWTAGAGIGYDRIETQGLQWPCLSDDHPGTEILHQKAFPIGQHAVLKCVEFVASKEAVSPSFPFILNTGRSLYQFNAGTMTARTRNRDLRPTDTLDVHPDDAAELGLEEGAQVRIVSPYGEATLPARFDRTLRRGEVFATFQDPKTFLNAVTGDTRDRTVGAPQYKVTAVRLEPVRCLDSESSTPMSLASPKLEP